MTQFLLYGRAVAACIVLSLSLTACGGGPSTPSQGASDQPSSAAPSAKLSCAP
jgi:hypothetical protein